MLDRHGLTFRAAARGCLIVLLWAQSANAATVPSAQGGPETVRAGIADTKQGDAASPVTGALPGDFSLRDGGVPQSSFASSVTSKIDGLNSAQSTDTFLALLAAVLAICGIAISVIAAFQWSALKAKLGTLEKAVVSGRKAISTRAAEATEALSLASAQSKAALDQAIATGKAADAAIAAQRAWIEVVARIVGPLTLDAQGAHFAIGWNVRNHGHAPATQVVVNIQIAPNMLGDFGLKEAVAEARRNCDPAKEQSGGQIIFPQQVALGRDTTVTIPKARFDAAVAAMQKRMNGTPIGIAICAGYRFWGGTGETVATYVMTHFHSGASHAIGHSFPRIPMEDLRLDQQSQHQIAR